MNHIQKIDFNSKTKYTAKPIAVVVLNSKWKYSNRLKEDDKVL